MKRVPGTPDAKRELLVGLDEKSLPYLAADILVECFGHTNVQVADGPGDGKRDVYSFTSSGKPCAAQCKFHASDVAVGSSATDELPIALLKFGARDGYFFTTGRVSPQARREFLDNFPGFSLRIVDGTELVDLVLSSPSLASAWSDGGAIGSHARRIGILVIARDASSDMPLAVDRLLNNMSGARVVWALVSTGALTPYRAPGSPTLAETGGATASGTLVFPDGAYGIQRVGLAKQSILAALQTAITSRAEGNAWLVRFGTPVVAPDALPDDFKLVYLPGEPETFVVTRDTVTTEQRFLVPEASTGWSFPKNVSVADSGWASWMSDELDVWFRVSLPDSGNLSFIAWKSSKLRAPLDASLFVVGPKDERERLLSLVQASLTPSIECAYGPGGILLGWFHPDVLSHTLVADHLGPEKATARVVPEHDAALTLVGKAIAQTSFKIVSSADAESIVRLAGAHHDPFTHEAPEHHSATLALRYEDVASPTALSQRECMFVSWWRVPSDAETAKAAVADAVREARPLRAAFHEVNRAPRCGEPVAMITFLVPSPVGQTSSAVLLANAPDVAETVTSIGASLRARVPEARLASRWFWDTEIRSPPSITWFRADGTSHEELISPSEDEER